MHHAVTNLQGGTPGTSGVYVSTRTTDFIFSHRAMILWSVKKSQGGSPSLASFIRITTLMGTFSPLLMNLMLTHVHIRALRVPINMTYPEAYTPRTF